MSAPMQAKVDPNRLMREAEAHFVAGRFAAARLLAEQVLRIVPGHPAVLHLYGLVLSRLGERAAARRALEAAARGLPNDPQVANNLGNLLGDLGEHEAALAAYDRAITMNPGFVPARRQRAATLDELGRYADARAEIETMIAAAPEADTFVVAASIERHAGDLRAAAAQLDAALAIDPAHGLAQRGRARIALETGEADAAVRHRDALAAAPDDRDLLLGYVGAAEDDDSRRDALDRLAAMLARDPGWGEGHRALAAARWESGARDGFAASFADALAVRPRDAGLWRTYVSALGKVDAHEAAAEVCAQAERATGDAAFAAAGFAYRSAAGEMDAADAILPRLPAGSVAPVALAKHLLRQRDPETAERYLAAATAAAPDDIEAWALRGVAWQLLGDARFEWLNGQPGLVRVDDLPLAARDIDTLAARLRDLHTRSTIRAGHSVRGGTQTGGNLFDRLDPEIAALRDLIRAAIERYRTGLPPADPAHPVLRHRDAALAIAGSWSIRLTGGGFHVQHIHPVGLVSAASWWAVPAPPPGDPLAGMLEIGGAPAYLALDVEPLHRIAPQPGRLVLFPSTLHHGTRAFPAGERISVAFDVVAR